jgi:hypothetical protein
MAQAVKGISLVSQANPRKSLGEDVRHGLLADVSAGKLAGEQPIIGLGSLVALMDIGDEILYRPIRQDSIAVRAVLAVSNVDVLFLAMNVMAMKRAHLTDPHARRVQENDLSLMFGINDGVNDGIHFITGRHLGELLNDTERRNLTIIPVSMKDVIIKVPQDSDVDVDGAGFQTLYILEKADKHPNLGPRNRVKGLAGELGLSPVDISRQAAIILGKGAVAQLTKGEDVLMLAGQNVVVRIHTQKPPENIVVRSIRNYIFRRRSATTLEKRRTMCYTHALGSPTV